MLRIPEKAIGSVNSFKLFAHKHLDSFQLIDYWSETFSWISVNTLPSIVYILVILFVLFTLPVFHLLVILTLWVPYLVLSIKSSRQTIMLLVQEFGFVRVYLRVFIVNQKHPSSGLGMAVWPCMWNWWCSSLSLLGLHVCVNVFRKFSNREKV